LINRLGFLALLDGRGVAQIPKPGVISSCASEIEFYASRRPPCIAPKVSLAAAMGFMALPFRFRNIPKIW